MVKHVELNVYYFYKMLLILIFVKFIGNPSKNFIYNSKKNNINFENILFLEEYINGTDPNNRICG